MGMCENIPCRTIPCPQNDGRWAVKTCNPSWEAKSHNHQRTLSYFESSHNTSYHGHGFEITTAVNLYLQPMQFVVLSTEVPAWN